MTPEVNVADCLSHTWPRATKSSRRYAGLRDDFFVSPAQRRRALPSNASRICDRLIRAGLLDRQDSPDDRRNITLSLTDAGRRLVNKVTYHRRTAITRVLRDMDSNDRELLTTALDRFVTAVPANRLTLPLRRHSLCPSFFD